MTTGITESITHGFFSGALAASETVLARYDVALNGIGFMIDWLDDSLQGPNTIPLYADGGQLDSDARPGEASLTRRDLWRRVISSFHHGAGQRWADRKDSDEFRFRSSKGIDPWTRDRLTLQRSVSQLVASDTIQEVVGYTHPATATILHYADNNVWRTAYVLPSDALDGGFSGAITGTGALTSGTDYPQLATDGQNGYGIDNGGVNIRSVVPGALSSTLHMSVTTSARCIGYAHGHLLVGGGSGGRTLFDATAGGGGAATTVATLNQLGSDWLCFAEGRSVIYGAANSAGVFQSKIYRIGFSTTTATLDAPVVAGLIPVGETIRTIYGYLDFLFVGTTKGFRMCRQDADGDLSVGPLIPISGGVKSFAANGPYVYFTWSNFDASSAGLGRIDITTFTDADLVPAYASDLMATVAGVALGAVVSNNSNTTVNAPRPWFGVLGAGGGIYVQHPTDYVTSGTLDTGLIGWDLTEQKDLTAVDIRTEPLAGTVTVSISADESVTFNSIDTQNSAGSAGMFMPAHHIGASRHEARLTLTQGSATTVPVVASVTLLAYPAVQRGVIWTLPLIVQDGVTVRSGYPEPLDFWEALFAIKSMAIPGTAPITVQFGSASFDAHLTDFQSSLIKMSDTGRPRATVRVQLKDMDRQVAA